MIQQSQIRLTIPDTVDPRTLFGASDVHLRTIERSFDVALVVRGNFISLTGETTTLRQLTDLFTRMFALIERGDELMESDLELMITQCRRGICETSLDGRPIITTVYGRAIRPKTPGQKSYVDAIAQHDISFGIGPAGTGKTYLAMAMAMAALKRHEVQRIVLARPVVEAGESLGYLPGNLEEKLDPYVRPLYDALFDMVDRDEGRSMIEQGVIEIAPLAFMRGRSFNDAFVILDEAQNTTPEQMKMFLTRLGFSSRFVITGDASQKDRQGRSGLDTARSALSDVEEIAFVELGQEDIVRHSLVAKIVAAYDAYEEKQGV